MNWWGILKQTQQTRLDVGYEPEPSKSGIAALQQRAEQTGKKLPEELSFIPTEPAKQSGKQSTLYDKKTQAAQQSELTDDSGSDAGSDVYNTNEKIQEYKTRMMRPAKGNKAPEVAKLVDLSTQAFVNATERNKLIRQIKDLATANLT